MIEISRASNGKPAIKHALGQTISASLAHDARYCLGVAGKAEQGCDIEVISHRSADEWNDLLAAAHGELLARLSASEPLDIAGTRIWTACESAYKARNVERVSLSIVQRVDDAVTFRALTDDGHELCVLTFPQVFTLGAARMVAIIVRAEPSGTGGQSASAADGAESSPGTLVDIGYDPSSYCIAGDAETRQFIVRWPLSFKELANPDKSAHLMSYVEGMGKVREIAMQPIFDEFARHLSTGRWGMVTNHSQVKILGEARLKDVVEVRYWVRPVPDSSGCSISLNFDWRKRGPGGDVERLALGELKTTWVRITEPGTVKAEPFPAYFESFVSARTPPGAEMLNPDALHKNFAALNYGTTVYSERLGAESKVVLGERTFDTCTVDANAVGNIYFSNYYAWQSRLIDDYIYKLFPRCYSDPSLNGTPVCLNARVNHLQDAMPFESIRVVMTLRALHTSAVTFGFDYYRVCEDGPPQRIAVGEQDVGWSQRNTLGKGYADGLPKPVAENLLGRIAGLNGGLRLN